MSKIYKNNSISWRFLVNIATNNIGCKLCRERGRRKVGKRFITNSGISQNIKELSQ